MENLGKPEPEARMKRIVFAVLLAAVACQAARMGREMNTWLGATDTDLVSQWGAPNRSATLSDSSRVLTWAHTYTPFGGGVATCEQSFTVSRAGQVTAWSMNGCGG